MRKILQYMQLILPYSCHFEFLNLEREMSRTRVEQPMKEMKEYYCCILLAITSLIWYLELFSPQITNGVIFLHLQYFPSTERGTDCIPTKRHWLVVSTVGCSPGTVKVYDSTLPTGEQSTFTQEMRKYLKKHLPLS